MYTVCVGVNLNGLVLLIDAARGSDHSDLTALLRSTSTTSRSEPLEERRESYSRESSSLSIAFEGRGGGGGGIGFMLSCY